VVLGDNRVPVYYAGGRRISEFRGSTPDHEGPEDWVGSTVALPRALLAPDADPATGISPTPLGPLRDVIAADPVGWLGAPLAAAFDGQPGLLVKLLDAGERLPVHCHPTRPFAREHLGSLFGKTEGWIVLRADPGARVWVGMREPVDRADLRRWIEAQDIAAMLAAMNEVAVEPGLVIYVPAGLPHAIGPGVMITELQEPTSYSVLADHAAFGLDADAATLGLGWDLALSCFDLGGYADRLGTLLVEPRGDSLFPAHADPFFRALRVRCRDRFALEPASFAVVVVTEGAGEVSGLPAARGATLVVPAAEPLTLTGELEALVCLPPLV
jgi:mannose-6-phosphate isomerase